MTLISTNFEIPWLWNYNNQISIRMACLCLNASLDPSNNVSQTQQLWSLAGAAEAGEHLNGCLSPSLFETPPWTDEESVLWWIVPIRVQLLLSGNYYQCLDCSTTLPCDERWFECERYNIGSIVLFATISRTPSRRMRTVSISLLNRITASIDGDDVNRCKNCFVPTHYQMLLSAPIVVALVSSRSFSLAKLCGKECSTAVSSEVGTKGVPNIFRSNSNWPVQNRRPKIE